MTRKQIEAVAMELDVNPDYMLAAIHDHGMALYAAEPTEQEPTMPEPTEPAPTIVDWQPIETVPLGVSVLAVVESDRRVFSVNFSTGAAFDEWTHWAPLPAPPARVERYMVRSNCDSKGFWIVLNGHQGVAKCWLRSEAERIAKALNLLDASEVER